MTDAWYVGASAVRQYLEVTGEPLSFAQATEKLTGLCAQIRQKYHQKPELTPRRLESGAYVYRGPAPERLRFVVAADKVEAGRMPQLVSVLPGHSGFRRS